MNGKHPETFDTAGLQCRKFRVAGRVQGVFFRASTQTAARDLGITGRAINLPDGSVEVLACGGIDELNKLAAWLREGPPMAQVSHVEYESLPYRELDDFTTG